LVPISVIAPYCVHGTNLAIIILSKLKLVHQLEIFLQSLYGNFSHPPKKIFEFQKLAKSMEIASNKLLKNVKTMWINMFSLANYKVDYA
jgi:hypothetical protein